MQTPKIRYADDGHESIGTLLNLRAPALIFGLMLGIGISFVTSRFEEVLAHSVQVAFFMPFIVYISDAVGTQTEAIYSRDLKTGKAKFKVYLRKEFSLGVIIGIVFGLISGLITWFWLGDAQLSLSVAIASCVAITTAPVVALIIAYLFQSAHRDPAASTGPIATVLQDMLSVVIYGVVASLIIL
ncbi:MAG: magnesium transporter [Candidatus Nomurabacteria bacterium]|nr:MAG: magnesium transporter [Candidatus Nomurabacteria bacterium]